MMWLSPPEATDDSLDGLTLEGVGGDGRVHGVSSAQEAGIDAQKKSLIAAEQLRPDVAERRKNFGLAKRFLDRGQLVFLDESGAKTNMIRLYGRAAKGERCVDHAPHGYWKTMTILSAIRDERGHRR